MKVVGVLHENLLQPNRREEVLADVHVLIEGEVANKRGAAGLAVRGGYAAVRKLSPAIVPAAVDELTPQLLAELEPFWQDFRTAGTGTFAQFLTEHSAQVTEALLAVTDRRAQASSWQAVRKVYATMRPAAHRHVREALPGLAELVQRHAEQ